MTNIKAINITAALKKAGFVKSVQSSKKIGYAHNYRISGSSSKGFVVKGNKVTLEHSLRLPVRGKNEERYQQARIELSNAIDSALNAHAEALNAAGFTTIIEDRSITVTGRN